MVIVITVAVAAHGHLFAIPPILWPSRPHFHPTCRRSLFPDIGHNLHTITHTLSFFLIQNLGGLSFLEIFFTSTFRCGFVGDY
ncbi:hypothetical protein V8F06_008427 [Rhypophila decipiens]